MRVWRGASYMNTLGAILPWGIESLVWVMVVSVSMVG